MKLNGKQSLTIWRTEDDMIHTYDQRYFPHETKIASFNQSNQAANIIADMVVRGAPLIGVTAAYGMYLATLEAQQKVNPIDYLNERADLLKRSRPTAVNLAWAVDQQLAAIESEPTEKWPEISLKLAEKIKSDDIETCRKIGIYGLSLIEEIAAKKPGERINILTHCNAGWLACIDWGTATSPIYQAKQKGLDIHVWVDETRPRNQGANLTAFELSEEGIPHTLVVDNTGGHLMQHGLVDMVIVGTDRTTAQGDVANKIGTYLKALAAFDNQIPFYVALPSSTIDWTIKDGLKEIPIELRNEDEIKYVYGLNNGRQEKVLICPENTTGANYGFDVTPARLVTKLITERGICDASESGLNTLFPVHDR